jgi:hypothetical protein
MEAISEAGRNRVVFGSGGIPDQFHLEWQKISQIETQVSVDTFQAVVSKNARQLFFSRESSARSSSPRDGLTVIRRPG